MHSTHTHACSCQTTHYLTAFALLLSVFQVNSQTISGHALTEQGNGIEEAGVSLSGPGSLLLYDLTDNTGAFEFTGLTDNETYTLCVSDEDNPLNGVTSFDLVLGAKHILNIQPPALTSPYQILSGDVNGDGHFNVLDLWETRRTILGITQELPTDSWGFLPSDVTFNDPLNPFPDYVAPGCRTVNLVGNAPDQNFVGFKRGDVNNSAIANSFLAPGKN